MRDRLTGTETDTVGAAGTKWHSQDEDRARKSVNVTLKQVPGEGDPTLLAVSVNDPGDEVAITLDDTDTIADDATVVSDGEEPLVKAFTDEDREQQLDLVHVPPMISYTLWEGAAFPLADRKSVVPVRSRGR